MYRMVVGECLLYLVIRGAGTQRPGTSIRIIPPSPPPCGTVPRLTPDTSAAPPATGIRPVPRTARPGKPSRRKIDTDNSVSGHPNTSAAIHRAGNEDAVWLSPVDTSSTP